MQSKRGEKGRKKWTEPQRNVRSIACTNICIMRVPEKKIETKNKFEKIMAKNFPNLMKRVNLHI